MTALLSVEGLRSGYGRVEVLRGVDLQVRAGETVALLGSNGAGKSTLNNTVSALVPAWSGRVVFDGADLTRARSREVVRAGLIQVPEGRRVFPNLSVLENLELGSYARGRERRAANLAKVFEVFPSLTVRENLRLGAINPRARPHWQKSLDHVFHVFPRLLEREAQAAVTLSGGEQQMLAIGRGLMAQPRLMLLDEPTLGLSPLMSKQIFELVQRLVADGLTLLLAEQDVFQSLNAAGRAYVIENGRVAAEGPAREIAADPRIKQAYLGL